MTRPAPLIGLVLAVLAIALDHAPAQVNDSCGGAITVPLPSSVTAGDTSSATVTAGMTGCNVAPDLWYKFVAPYSGTVEISTCGFLGGSASFDTVINVWSWNINPCTTGCGLCGAGHMACNDDYCGAQSYLSIAINSGQTYHIQVGGWNGATGSFSLVVITSPNIPPNNSCANALPITVNGGVGGDTAGASTGPDPVPSCGLMGNDVWYSFVAPSCGTFTLTTCGAASFDTVIAVWQGSCGALSEVACNDDACASTGYNLNSTLSFVGTLGTTYYISVGGFNGAWGTFSLYLTGSAAFPMTLSFINNGPGSIGYSIAGAPPNGTVLTAITGNQGAFPSGWFYGIDILIPDLLTQWLLGFPFIATPTGPCSTATIGPFYGLPGGFTVYGVSLGLPNGGYLPTAFSNPASGTVP